MNATLQFEIVAGTEFTRLREMWQELETRSDNWFFLSWSWVGCWIETIPMRPYVVVGRDSERVVLLGLIVPNRRTTLLGISSKAMHLQNTGNRNIDVITVEYNGFLVDRDWAGKVERDAIAFLLKPVRLAGDPQDELHLKNVVSEYENLIPPGRFLTSIVAVKPSWRVDLEAVRESAKPYLDHISANTRQQIRRSIRLYEHGGPFTTERARNLEEAFSFLEELKQLHQKYWMARGEPGSFSYPYFEKFQRRLIETCLPRGEVELVRIARGSETIGCLFNFVYRKQVYAYQSGFLYEADAKLKPGLVSHALCIDLHVKEGANVYDFMAGDGRYKANLGIRGPDMIYILVQRPTLVLRAERKVQSLGRLLRRAAGRTLHRAKNGD